ncbi:MAG: peptidoglycan bridge formation glycyltransferase FemA/FemB family protein, partial [Chloroflexi bacterium]
RGALFLKIDPDVTLFTGDPAGSPTPDATGQAVQAALQRRGWLFSPEQIQFKNTVLLSLEGAPEDWLARMKSKWRYNIRYARRNGVKIRPGGPDDIGTFYQMYAETAARDGFLIRPQAYYHDVWSHFLAADRADMLLASVEGQVVAGLVLFYCGARAWYLYGASTGAHRKRMPNHLLQFAAMQRAAERGCTHYDLWGAPNVFDERDSMWGVYRFKQGFGGQTVQGLGAYDFPARPALYRLFTQAMPRVRSLLRKFTR